MYTCTKQTLTTHGNRVERRRRRQQHARADGFGRGGAAAAQAAAALSARARRLPAQLERGQVHREAWRRGETRRRWRWRRRQRHARADGFGRGGAATAWAAAALSARARRLRSSSAALHILLGDLRARERQGSCRAHRAAPCSQQPGSRQSMVESSTRAPAQRGARRRSWQARQGSRRRWRAGARCRGRRPSAATSW